MAESYWTKRNEFSTKDLPLFLPLMWAEHWRSNIERLSVLPQPLFITPPDSIKQFVDANKASASGMDTGDPGNADKISEVAFACWLANDFTGALDLFAKAGQCNMNDPMYCRRKAPFQAWLGKFEDEGKTQEDGPDKRGALALYLQAATLKFGDHPDFLAENLDAMIMSDEPTKKIDEEIENCAEKVKAVVDGLSGVGLANLANYYWYIANNRQLETEITVEAKQTLVENVQLAQKYYDMALGKSPEEPRVLLLAGNFYMYYGDYGRAADLLEKALSINSTRIYAHIRLACIAQKRNDMDKALYHWNNIVAFHNNYEVRGRYADFLILSGKLAPAKAILEQCLGDNGDYAFAKLRIYFIEILEGQPKTEDDLIDLPEVLTVLSSMNPKPPATFGFNNEFMKDLITVMSGEPDALMYGFGFDKLPFLTGHWVKAWCQFLWGQYSNCITRCENIIAQLDFSNYEWYFLQAQAQMAENRTDQAKKSFEQTITCLKQVKEVHPRHRQIQEELVKIYEHYELDASEVRGLF